MDHHHRHFPPHHRLQQPPNRQREYAMKRRINHEMEPEPSLRSERGRNSAAFEDEQSVFNHDRRREASDMPGNIFMNLPLLGRRFSMPTHGMEDPSSHRGFKSSRAMGMHQRGLDKHPNISFENIASPMQSSIDVMDMAPRVNRKDSIRIGNTQTFGKTRGDCVLEESVNSLDEDDKVEYFGGSWDPYISGIMNQIPLSSDDRSLNPNPTQLEMSSLSEEECGSFGHAGIIIDGSHVVSGNVRSLENAERDLTLLKRPTQSREESRSFGNGRISIDRSSVVVENARILDQETRNAFSISRAESYFGDGFMATSFDRKRLSDFMHDKDTSKGLGETQRERDEETMHELLVQYKTGLSDLTFNSKPIITNLTIIAGENLHASKAIADTICVHILEAAVDQKLPSLYLLDSIVKNISNSYVKHFAARLPEVFVKSYRQVDASQHPAMKHLFKTWRGVFTNETLLEIEAELQFNMLGNDITYALNSAKSSESPPPHQHTSHGIHVNPKYLETQRQKSQQTSQLLSGIERDTWAAAEAVNVRKLAASLPEFDYASLGGGGDKPLSSNEDKNSRGRGDNISRGEESLRVPETIPFRYGMRNDYEFQQHTSRCLIDSYGNVRGIRGQKMPSAVIHPPYDFDSRDRSRGRDRKSSKEEYRLADASPRLEDLEWSSRKENQGWHHRVSDRDMFFLEPRKPFSDQATTDHSSWLARNPDFSSDEKVTRDVDEHVLKSSQNDFVEPRIMRRMSHPIVGYRNQVPLYLREQANPSHTQPSIQSFQVRRNAPAYTLESASQGYEPESSSLELSSSSKTMIAGLEFKQTLPSNVLAASSFVSTPAQPPQNALSPQLHVFISEGQASNMQRISEPYVAIQPNQPYPVLNPLEASQLPDLIACSQQTAMVQGQAQNKPVLPQLLHPQIPAHLLESLHQQLQRHLPPLSEALPQPMSLQVSSQSSALRQSLPQQSAGPVSLSQALELSGSMRSDNVVHSELHNQVITSNALAGFSPTIPQGYISLEPVTNIPPQSVSGPSFEIPAYPPLPSGPPPTLVGKPAHYIPPISDSKNTIIAPSLAISSLTSTRLLQPPLPRGPPPQSSQVGSSPLQSFSIVSNNLTSLLSSLVAQGMISTPLSAQQVNNITTTAVISGPQSSPPHQVTGVSMGGSLSKLPPILPPSTMESTRLSTVAVFSENQESVPGASNVFTDSLPKALTTTEFRPNLLRERHASVIQALYCDFPRQCTSCGLRFKQQEEHSKHMDWHVSRNRRQKSSKKVSRKWYVSTEDWLSGTGATESESSPVFFADEIVVEKLEEVVAVPADENQIACALCGEPFEDFYSDDTEEWMYRGAEYMNAAPGTSPLSSLLRGPIVHVKCRTESASSTVVDAFEDAKLVLEDLGTNHTR